MNTDQVKGEWDKLVGKAKRAWGELTDDDVLKAEGSADKLFGVIQKKFGDTKEVIKDKLDKLHL
ncbi:MAG: CsbD family protein [Deltaproteobacteria bacterium]|nr:CsbD family protein [Deltaproteobacteria bacterium]